MLKFIRSKSFISQSIVLICSLINLKYVIKELGISDFGLAAYYISIFGFFNTFFGSRIWETGIYSLSKEFKIEPGKQFSIFLKFTKIEFFFNLFIFSIFTLLILLFGESFNINRFAIIPALTVITSISKELSSHILLINNKLFSYYFLRVIKPFSLLLYLISLKLLNIEINIYSYLFGIVFSSMFENLLYFLFTFMKVLNKFKIKEFKSDINIFQFNLNSYLSSLARSIWEKTDLIWINIFSSPETLGLYALIKRILSNVQVINFIYWNKVKPTFTQNIFNKEIKKLISEFNLVNLYIGLSLYFFLIIFMPLIMNYFEQLMSFKVYLIFTLMYISIFIWSFIPYPRFAVTLLNKMRLSLYCNLILALVFNLSLIILTNNNSLNIYNFLTINIIVAITAYYYWFKNLNEKYL